MDGPFLARLASRAGIAVAGEDWRPFLQGLVSQDVLTLGPGEMRFGALLTPQGRLAFDLFLLGTEEGCLIDCAAAARPALLERLSMYRLRAKVEIAPAEPHIEGLWAAQSAPGGWWRDPRRRELGFRGYDAPTPAAALVAEESAYEAHRLRLGIPGSADFRADDYPIEADFDLLGGIDFKKGCFIGQETASRVKRRGAIRSRMVPINFAGPPPAAGSEVLVGDLRAGEARSGMEGRAMALLRLDRLAAGPLRLADGRPCQVDLPSWLQQAG
ncbi:MAG TPA: folate-binding protein [Caulobacteraceae bacterium]|nr:folate-binding protein [Caulobacteraceae bacterium]